MVTHSGSSSARAKAEREGLYDPRNEHDACGVGFIADLKNRKSHKIVEDALSILTNLTHRGAVGADPDAGDGAGILVQIPHAFFSAEAKKLGIKLTGAGTYAVGQLFLPQDKAARIHCERVFERVLLQEGLVKLGWRDVPVDPAGLPPSVMETEPVHRQIFIGRGKLREG